MSKIRRLSSEVSSRKRLIVVRETSLRCASEPKQTAQRICIGNMVPCDLFADVVARNSVAVDLDLYGTRREVYLRQKIPHFIVFERTDHLVAQRIVP